MYCSNEAGRIITGGGIEMNSYVSNVLCHFVGRSLETDDDRFDLLVRIIKEGQLKANLEKPNSPSASSTWTYSGERLGEIFQQCDCVCFCDIPDNLLGIHTQKYSKFGMGFDKSLLVKAGARPVTYVPLHDSMKEFSETSTPKESSMYYFIYLSNLANTLLPLLMLINQFKPLEREIRALTEKDPAIKEVLQVLDSKIVSSILNGQTHQMLYSMLVAWSTQNAYIKVFDETLANNDPDNYYMEREWRVIKSVAFGLNDIQKIYLPSEQYVEKFQDVFPSFSGEFYVLN